MVIGTEIGEKIWLRMVVSSDRTGLLDNCLTCAMSNAVAQTIAIFEV